MPMWGDLPTSLKNKPIYVLPRSYKTGTLANTYATQAGWVVKRKDGVVETLVSIQSLASRLANANITSIEWSTSSQANAAQGNVWVSFDEEVVIIGANLPTFNIAVSNSANITVVTGVYASGNGNNRLRFIFTAPNAVQANIANSARLYIANGPISVVANTNVTIKDKADGNNAFLTVANSVAANAGSIAIV